MREGGLKRALAAAILAMLSSGATVPTDDVANRWKRHVAILASDAFAGRLPGSVGETRTTDYLIRAFAQAGLVPGGEQVNGRRTWFQQVPVIETRPPTIRRLSIDGPGSPGALGADDGLMMTGTQASAAVVDLAAAPLVFVGYGIDAPEYGWDDYKGADLRGKIAVILFGEPLDAGGKRRFPGDTLTQNGNPRLKVQAAVRRGAVATLMIHEAKVLGYPWSTMANSLAQVRLSLVPAPGGPPIAQAGGWLREDLAARLFAAAGSTLDAVKARAGQPDFRPAPIGGLTLTAGLDIRQRRITTRNVIGLLPGRTHPDETLIVGAHWDHQGTGAPDAAGDRVYNGAIDNASGVATVLEIARVTAQRGRAARTIAFVAWTMEEPGILGSEYYVAHPLYPLEKTVAVINFDTMMPLGRARDFSQNADPASDLTDLIRDAGERQGRTLTIEPHKQLFVRMRSDHAPFVRAGVPALFYMAGEDLIHGGTAKARDYFATYFSQRYHQRSDEYSPDWDASGIAEDVALLSDLSTTLANTRTWPAWKAGAEWKAIRDRSAAARE